MNFGLWFDTKYDANRERDDFGWLTFIKNVTYSEVRTKSGTVFSYIFVHVKLDPLESKEFTLEVELSRNHLRKLLSLSQT